MFKVSVFAVALVAFVFSAAANPQPPCAGCPTEQDPNKPELLTKVSGLLAQENSDKQIEKIISHQTQVVAGIKHIIKYQTTDGSVCEMTYVEAPWISKDPQNVQNRC